MNLSFDIETIGIPYEEQKRRCKPFIDKPFEREEFKPAKNWKAETVEKRKQQHQKQEDEREKNWESTRKERENEHFQSQLEKALLKAEYSRVFCASFYDGRRSFIHWADNPEDEKHLLAIILDTIDDALRFGQLIGANSNGFDIPFIYRRCLVNGLGSRTKLLCNWSNGRCYINKNSLDVLEQWRGPEWASRPIIGLERLAQTFGVQGKSEPSGKGFAELAKQDRQRAETYAAQDAKIPFDVAVSMGLIPVPKPEVLPF